MAEYQFAVVGGWALASDGVQWILMRRRRNKDDWRWQHLSFVRSTRDILARCMREKGVDAITAAQLLQGLPDTFEQWKRTTPALERQQHTLEAA